MNYRLHQFDFLRGVAAFSVCLYHYLYSYPQREGLYEPISIMYVGQFGVQFFFILSGFVISYSVIGKNTFEFIRSRFLRIYPQYFVCLIATFVICYLLGSRQISVGDFVLNIFMLSTIFNVKNVDGVYWSI